MLKNLLILCALQFWQIEIKHNNRLHQMNWWRWPKRSIVEPLELFNECKKKPTWCGNAFGICILIISGECSKCSYFLGKKTQQSVKHEMVGK